MPQIEKEQKEKEKEKRSSKNSYLISPTLLGMRAKLKIARASRVEREK